MLENVVCLWQYYNSALVPSCAPHEEADESVVHNNEIWKYKWHGYPFFARWTTCFDCGYKTEWWYCIKDTPYTIDTLTAKKRYIINKGRKNFDVRIIDPYEYAAELAKVQIAAFSAYPKAYKSQIDYNRQVYSFKQPTNNIFFAAFKKNTDILCGYSVLTEHNSYVTFSVQQADPAYEKYEVNAALVDSICTHYSEHLTNGFYISDGERNILHETAFQNYLEKYFGFRRAYCVLHIKYRPFLEPIITILYPIRTFLFKSNMPLIKKVSSVLKMEEICRSFI